MDNKETATRLYTLIQEGLLVKNACSKVGLLPYQAAPLLKKYGYPTKPKGFQLGNKTSGQFKKGKWIEINCIKCDKEFSVAEWDFLRGRKCCSRDCHLKWLGKIKKGKNHWNWKGGITNKWDKLHNSPEYKNWRLEVWKRDNFRCRICFNKQSRLNPLNAHHIKSRARHPKLIMDLDNGLTLCRDCHDIVHYGRVVHIGGVING